MIHHKALGKIMWIITIAMAVGSIMLTLVKPMDTVTVSPLYPSKLFDDSYVHTIDIHIQDINYFFDTAINETYQDVDVCIDGEWFYHVGFRAKGNNSLHLIHDYDLIRYSFKIEFDHYIDGYTYHGLDKLSLDASFQDNSYLKTYMVFDMMDHLGVNTPLCSYVMVSINGQPFGLYLAIEEMEEAYASRSYGQDHGVLYKPDYRHLNGDNRDIALQYIDDDISSYAQIFDHANTDVTSLGQHRLIDSLYMLNHGDATSVVNMVETIPYFVIQSFVLNWDSYLGYTGHNYLLYEKAGILTMLPWDYNLAFGTYCLGMSDPIKDSSVLINYPFFTPNEGDIMTQRPLYHRLMQDDEAFEMYRDTVDRFLIEYIESGYYQQKMVETIALIDPYVKNDPTAFCSYEDFHRAVETLDAFMAARGKSVRLQLQGKLGGTLALRDELWPNHIDCSTIHLQDLGDFDDLRNAYDSNQAVMEGLMQTDQQ